MSTTGGRSASAENGDCDWGTGSPGRQASLLKKIAASSKRMMSGEPKSTRIPALGLAQALISKLNRFGRS